ncbi:MAG: 3-phosphoshikimate 1-carboxyvinyltransferase [Candidatus Bathyarchaeota archaeon]|nr:3-phosphoshikimate 1-carboxyvinyltransferase [Candidatus Bathyarchaeota archaeon]
MTEVKVRKTDNLQGEVAAPPSKAYTQRMLVAAALSLGTSKITEPLHSEDTEATLRAIKALGAKATADEGNWTVTGANPLSGAKEPINCGESGATLRFMIPVAALAAEPSVFLLGSSLEQRPLEPLLESLRQLGAEVSIQKRAGKVVVQVKGGGLAGGKTAMRGDVSSQFVSGLMFACPKAQADTGITLTTPLESKGYVQMTQEVLAQHGVKVSISQDFRCLHIPSNQVYQPRDHRVPGDFSSAAFLLAAAAVTRSRVHVGNLDCQTAQGDKAIVGILKRMGADVHVRGNRIEVAECSGLLNAVDVDAKDIPDLVPVCAVLACYARGISVLHDAQRLRYKESDRLLSICMELKKMGAGITMTESSLTVKGPCALRGCTVDPHSDHRIAMACAVAALGAEGETTIQDAECVRKSYPSFFDDLRVLGADVSGWELDR